MKANLFIQMGIFTKVRYCKYNLNNIISVINFDKGEAQWL